MDDTDLVWMKYSIEVAKNSQGLCVGAVAIRDNKLVNCAINSENSSSSWLNDFLENTHENESIDSLYLTINTMSSYHNFDLNKLLKYMTINKIYVGLPDPKLTRFYKSDPLVKLHVHRYPDTLQKLILNQNHDYYFNSKQNIRYSPYYANVRISNLIINELSAIDIPVDKRDIESNKNINSLTQFIANKYNINFDELTLIIYKVLSKAFGEKYSSYDYNEDVRSVNLAWENSFYDICKSLLSGPLNEQSIINVGVGSGDEAKDLFKMCPNITFVDIANQGLDRIKSYMPYAKTLCSRAENLSMLKDNTYDLYVSLRTYNSSFFEPKPAIREAYRVLKNNGRLIISIANGFLSKEQNRIIQGLIIPNTDYVDIYRGLNSIREVSAICADVGFKNIKIIPTDTEIYLIACRNE